MSLVQWIKRHVFLGQTRKPRTMRVTDIPLGEAWSSNTVNTVAFRAEGILTKAGYQFTAFYVNESTLRLVRRTLSTGKIVTFDLNGDYKIRDAHNSVSLGVDRHGFIHISYDHHSSQLRYRRTTNPYDIECWTQELEMTGRNEEHVTYPTFISGKGDSLLLLYRSGTHNCGAAFIKEYNEAAQRWEDRDVPVLNGANDAPWTSNAYWNRPVVGAEGSLHLAFVWRTHTVGPKELVNNINVCYARSFDNGRTWNTSKNNPVRTPMTPTNAETVWAVAPASNLINQSGMALDSRNLPHIVFYSDDENGIPQYQHLHFDGRRWHHQYISKRDERFELKGGGTLRIPMSRPQIVIDSCDNAYVLYRSDTTNQQLVAIELRAPHYTPAGITHLTQDVGYAEPIVDYFRWKIDEVLTFLVQRTDQPDHDVGNSHAQTSIFLRDVQFYPSES